MDCDIAREAISARIDGEDPGLPDDALAAHLRTCDACRDWQERAHALTRRARLGGPFLDHDLTAAVLADTAPAGTAPARRARRRRLTRRVRLSQRAGLALLAAVQLAITVPLLFLGDDGSAGTHAAHELGSFDLALAIAFAVGAIRPALSAGLAWPCAIAAAGLVGTAILDLIGGKTIGADEAQHLIAAAGAVLLFWQARTVGAGTADPSTGDPSTGDPSTGSPSTGDPGVEPRRTPVGLDIGQTEAGTDAPSLTDPSGGDAARAPRKETAREETSRRETAA